jgi:5,10-methylenetetrahydromethanopterin reductase
LASTPGPKFDSIASDHHLTVRHQPVGHISGSRRATARASQRARLIELARKTRISAGLDPDAITFGAYVNCGCHTDLTAARNLVRGSLTTFARFSVMYGTASGPVSDSDRAVLEDLRNAYDMRAHTRGDSPQVGVLTAPFIDRFAIAGTPDQCVARLRRLEALGLDKVALTGAMRGVSEADAAISKRLIETQVLLALTRD